jgi:ribosomal protein S6E (S10)
VVKQGREKQSIRTCAHPCYRPKEEGERSGSKE